MSFADSFIRVFRSILPSPFTIAVLLTGVTYFLALFLTESTAGNPEPHYWQLLTHWETGFWELLTFSMQMLLMLVLGHVLALSKPVNRLINVVTRTCNSTANAAFMVTFLTILVSLFNWGLGLIFGAVFARKVAENAVRNNISLNYPIIGAAGYSGLMVWHGGLSGSAPLKVNEAGHFLYDRIGQITLDETLLSTMNITIAILLIVLVPAAMFLLAKTVKPTRIEISRSSSETDYPEIEGAERLDHSKVLGYLFAFVVLLIVIMRIAEVGIFKALNPNFINFTLFGLGVILHGNFHRFVNAVNQAITGAAGIAIQFPLYAGIMGIMKYSGLVTIFSNFFVEISNEVTFPVFTFISAGMVNLFVPSGGGQWGVQGPIIVEAASQLGVSIPKSIMALAYGDQITNMLQPFWALPLLGITGLKAKDILPYTLFLLIIGTVIFVGGLLIF